jgi:stage V sporulation protein G
VRMKITEVRIRLRTVPRGRLKATASITLEDQFVVRGITVLQGSRGLVLGLPRGRHCEGGFGHIAHPITEEYREYISDTVFAAYAKAVNPPDDGLHAVGCGARLKVPPQIGARATALPLPPEDVSGYEVV